MLFEISILQYSKDAVVSDGLVFFLLVYTETSEIIRN